MIWTSRPGAFQWFTLGFCYSFVSKCNFHTLFAPSLNVPPVVCDALSHFLVLRSTMLIPFFFFTPDNSKALLCAQQLILESFWWSCLHHSYKFKNRLLCNPLMGTHWINRRAKKKKKRNSASGRDRGGEKGRELIPRLRGRFAENKSHAAKHLPSVTPASEVMRKSHGGRKWCCR